MTTVNKETIILGDVFFVVHKFAFYTLTLIKTFRHGLSMTTQTERVCNPLFFLLEKLLKIVTPVYFCRLPTYLIGILEH